MDVFLIESSVGSAFSVFHSRITHRLCQFMVVIQFENVDMISCISKIALYLWFLCLYNFHTKNEGRHWKPKTQPRQWCL